MFQFILKIDKRPLHKKSIKIWRTAKTTLLLDISINAGIHWIPARRSSDLKDTDLQVFRPKIVLRSENRLG